MPHRRFRSYRKRVGAHARRSLFVGPQGGSGGSGGGASDNFNRGDDPASLTTSSSGPIYTRKSGNLGVIANQFYVPVNNGPVLHWEAADFGLADGTFGIRLTVLPVDVDNYIGVVIRALDADNAIFLTAQSTTVTIQKREAGVTISLGSGLHGGLVASDFLSLVAAGSDLSAQLEGVEKATGTSAFQAALTFSGPLGYRSVTGVGMRGDDFSATP